MLSILQSETVLTEGRTGAPAHVHTEQRDSVTVYTVSAHSDNGCLDADTAVITTLEIPDEIDGFMAIQRHSTIWCRPQFGKSFSEVPENTQMLLWKKNGGGYGCILPMCNGAYATLLNTRDGKLCAITAASYDQLCDCETIAWLASEGDDPYALMQDCARAAAEIANIPLRDGRRYPEVLEYLGWCTWDAMEIWVNEAEILEKCQEFTDKSIPVRWAILDDMWADIAWTQKLPKFTPHTTSFGVMHASKMNDYEADAERFPHGLAGCIARIKERYGMKVGLWHTVSGYWAGLTPDGPAAARLADYTMRNHDGQILPDLRDAGKAFQYYYTMHDFFRRCGVDFLKVDNQSFVRTRYRNDVPVGIAAKNMHAGLEGSVGALFGGDMINCMGMATESMLSRTSSAVSRCSDDFQPENRAWFAKHVMQCAYNGLLQGQFYYNDWDMWWSDDEQAKKNSILRALSGGPIYVSDRLDRSRAEVFAPLCFSDGRILRPDSVAVPTEDCLLTDMANAERPMKVFNMAGETAYIAAFHLRTDDTLANGGVSAAEIPGLCGDRFLLHEHFSGAWKVVTRDEVYTFTLQNADDFRLFSLTPIDGGMAILGNTDKFIAVRAVLSSAPGVLHLYEGGTVKLYSEKPITHAENEAGHPLTVERDGDLYTIRANVLDREILYR